MAGSFDVFRRNQRSALAALAIMAMIAFFVLPPFLQMGGGGGGGRDPVVVSWQGGELLESGVERAVAMRGVLNRFLMESAAASGRDPAQIGLLPDDERSVVRTAVLAREAEANGVVVSDAAINDFLGQWTNNLVRQEQFDQIIGRLRVGPMGVSQYDLFETLRTVLAAQSMQMLFQSGFAGDPPGWRWDYFRRLEQSATVEVVPVVVETLAANVAAPSEATLRAFFEQYKDDLPAARSAEPGFREPHRAKYEYLVAKTETFEAAAAKEVTDAQVAEYYEKNKTSLFRAKPAAEKPAAEKPAGEKPAGEKPAGEKPAAEKPAGEAQDAAPEAGKPVAPQAQEPAPQPAPDKGSDARRSRFSPVAFRQPAAAEASPAAAVAQEAAPSAAEKDGKQESSAAEKKAEGTETEKKAVPPADEAANFEPLEKVKDDIRKRLARQEADKRIDAIFSAIATDMTRYAEDFALWQAGGKDAGAAAPTPPNFDKIAATQGLEAGRSELVTADQAVAAGPLGGSFELVPDASSRFGIRQQRWIDMIFGQGAPTLRPVTSRDVEGNRSISWKTEDQPEFTPSFQSARADVERAWRIVEARSLARNKAEEIARQVGAGQTLAAAVATTPELKAEKVGPFTWLTQGTVPLGTPPSLSQPEGISMPGEEFMQAVFGLEPGNATVAFNEPRTVCYVIRLDGLEPPLEKLRTRFMEARDDQRRLAMVAQRETSRASAAWVEALEKRHAVTWHREPR
ncbi:MAG: hypothetical protein LW698_13915 [Planctomycetaceae bacterium]|nr:hypothetical protein [Planctomycetaceae bacterium]